MKGRKLEVAVISDIHLATHACKANIVLKYLKSIHPSILVLNGDIIDSWRFSRTYFPKDHLKVIRQLIKMLEKGVSIFYISGNHDEFLRKLNQTQIGNLHILNQLVLELDGQKTWIFHGDIFDHIIHRAKWLAKMGAATYGLLTVMNKLINAVLLRFGYNRITIYDSIKKKLLKEKTPLNHFERAVTQLAAEKNCQTVICGHTHVPKEKTVVLENGIVHYINCGDWVDHFTAAEYANGNWNLFQFEDLTADNSTDEPDIPDEKQIYHSLIRELAFNNVLQQGYMR